MNFACPNCEDFDVSATLWQLGLGELLGNDSVKRAVLSHALRKMHRSGHPMLTQAIFDRLIKGKLPTVAEQCDNLILWLGENLPVPAHRVWIRSETHRAVMGAESEEGFWLIVRYLVERKLVDCNPPIESPPQTAHAMLSVEGWANYETLRRNIPQSRVAFMAMKFGEPVLEAMFKEVFKPAVSQTGFELRSLEDEPRAGLIDDRLRVEIRNARFVVSDLTHDNLGAYWEAGFAEGLGKPVVYTCEKSKFEREKTHFDTNHHLTIPWDKALPKEAAEDLKATIRATLPGEARMSDA